MHQYDTTVVALVSKCCSNKLNYGSKIPFFHFITRQVSTLVVLDNE